MFFEKLNIILASQSPRRAELMRGADVKFKVCEPYFTDESFDTNRCNSSEIAEILANRKVDNYPFIIEKNDVIISADTVVVVDDTILGKPMNEGEATKMLKLLSGKEHLVITGVAIRCASFKKSFSTATKVKFCEITDKEIEYYIENYKPFDKAGSYGIQEWIGHVGIEAIAGSYFSVMGLPIQRLFKILLKIENIIK